MAKQSRKERRQSRTDLSVTPLAQHKKIGKDVLPPFAQLKRDANSKMIAASWSDERLPEMLWAALTIVTYGREDALDRFRRLGKFIGDTTTEDDTRKAILGNVTLTGLSNWSDAEFDSFVGIVVSDAPGAFSGLTLFEALPGRDRWLRVAPLAGEQALEILKSGVGNTLWHQTQEATDCRWMKVLAALLSGMFGLPDKGMIREVLDYPERGDQTRVRPTIRANEMAIGLRPDQPRHVTAWASAFWAEAYALTRDDHARVVPPPPARLAILSRDVVLGVHEALRRHCDATTSGTAVDARHEASFGFAAYALDLVLELLQVGNATSRMARMALRSISELVINFATLARRDEAERWSRFRDYGYGEAKKAYLKMLETEILPEYVSLESLEALSNEDVWHEFQEIHIGNWADSDLRSMSEANGTKDEVYDRYYDWSSAFVHGNWAALRDAEYDLCLNPLHRPHRVLSTGPKALPDVISDAAVLTNRILVLVDSLYPGFADRLPEDMVAV